MIVRLSYVAQDPNAIKIDVCS